MQINSLQLHHFKNYQNAFFFFSDRINVICGENAQGKTNLLESLFFLSCVKPIHAKKERDLITFQEKRATLEAEVSSFSQNYQIKMDFSSAPRKITVNGIKQTRVTEYIGHVQTVLFIPDDLFMIKDGPAVRRRFLNIAISQLKPHYIHVLSRYNRVLEQKNKLLKSEYDARQKNTLLDVYNEKLASLGAQIITYRAAFAEKISKTAEKIHYEMSKEREILHIVYQSDRYVADFTQSPDEIAEALYRHACDRRSAELESRSCLVGPHRDDLDFMINQNSAKGFASQGQIRTAVLATKLAEREVFFESTGEYPILLLDDVLSELDLTRQNYILNKIGSGQVFITSCENLISPALYSGKVFTISNGSLLEDKEF